MILGNGRMVSRWPARGGPVIRDGIVYFAAGIWQSDGIFLLAIDAESGRELWRNDEAGKIYMPQPHGGANGRERRLGAGVSRRHGGASCWCRRAAPCPPALPAQDGQFLYYHLQANGHIGGTQTVAAGDSVLQRRHGLQPGDRRCPRASSGRAASPRLGEGIVHGGKKELRAMKVVEKTAPDRKGVPTKSRVHEVLWSVPGVDGSAAVIVAGETICRRRRHDRHRRRFRDRNKVIWTDARSMAAPYGLAAANGRLYVEHRPRHDLLLCRQGADCRRGDVERRAQAC